MEEVDLLIVGGTIITMDPQRRVLREGAIAVAGSRIIAVGEADEHGQAVLIGEQEYSAPKVIRCVGKAVIPGLVNAHTHMFQDLGRGLGDDLDLWPWLSKFMWPFAAAVTSDDAYVAALLACVEMIKSGTTCVLDNHYQPTDTDTILRIGDAMQTVGIRGVIARGIKGRQSAVSKKMRLSEALFVYSAEEELAITEECIRVVNFRKGNMVQVWPAPLNIIYVDQPLVVASYQLAEKYDVGCHTHCSEAKIDPDIYLEEYGQRPIEWLYEVGLLSPRMSIAHGIWLSDREIELVGKTHACIVYNAVCNAYMASGVARIPELVRAGATVALGSDGPASNNNEDMLEVLKTAVLLQKVSRLDPLAISAEQVFEFATLGGARALGLEAEIGSLEPGKRADIVIVDLEQPHISPVHRPLSSIVYCANGNDVLTTIIDGEIVMEDRVVKTVSEADIVREAQRRADSIVARAGLTHLRARP
ncbi:MAG: amidohydrolase [Chloroflexi bacterium]|nr:amidohydrolase [Chloroflexota bacterium]MCL5076141.1 amidohydrolase [Chloroflexota bacterium]